MKFVLVVFVICVASTLAGPQPQPQPQPQPSVKADDQDWWKTAVFYQVYPRSFKDSSTDGETDKGVGDLNGVFEKLNHFVASGVTAIWLSPIYKSPMADMGYDISDFREIDPIFGNMETFDELVAEAHTKGLKIVMDFVPNHSSDQHEWFKASADPTHKEHEKFKNYYTWVSEIPNNWLSIWGGPAWTKHDSRNEYYLHQFSSKQPDLNFRNEEVVNEMTDVMKFWLDKGVDGFRIDAIPHLFESENLNQDEPAVKSTRDDDEWNSLDHIHTKDQDETYQQVYKWREWIDNYSKESEDKRARIIMTEAYTSIENTMKYYGTEEELGAHFTFNFQLITPNEAPKEAENIVEAVKSWSENMSEKYVSNWVIGNHDQWRVGTRYGKENIDGMNMLVMLLPGVAVTYYGEEIGMLNGAVSKQDCQDISVCDKPEEEYLAKSRDFARTPYHWNAGQNAGFNDGAKTPWLPVSAAYVENNLEKQLGADNSHYKVYQKLTELRPELKNMDMTIEHDNGVVLLLRTNSNNDQYLMVFNVAAPEVNIDLQSKLKTIKDNYKVVLLDSTTEDIEVGSTIDAKNLDLKGHQSILLYASTGVVNQISIFLTAALSLIIYLVQ